MWWMLWKYMLARRTNSPLELALHLLDHLPDEELGTLEFCVGVVRLQRAKATDSKRKHRVTEGTERQRIFPSSRAGNR